MELRATEKASFRGDTEEVSNTAEVTMIQRISLLIL